MLSNGFIMGTSVCYEYVISPFLWSYLREAPFVLHHVDMCFYINYYYYMSTPFLPLFNSYFTWKYPQSEVVPWLYFFWQNAL